MAKGSPRDPQRERFWRRHVRQQRLSRLSVRDYCDLHRLYESAFYFWRREIAARDRQRNSRPAVCDGRRRSAANAAGPVEAAFLPVSVVEPPAAGDAAVLDIRLTSGHRLRVRAGCDRRLLADVVAVLEGRPC
jgi:hypothetical protein